MASFPVSRFPFLGQGRVVVTGSVAFDYLMTFPGRFVEHLIPDRLSRLSVSFLVDEMRRVSGGCASNIAYSLALLGETPLLFATAGHDASDYRDRLAREGVDVSGLLLHDDVFTASFFVSTDPAAMARYTAECRRSGIPFLYDPSQQVARLSGEELREGLTGAAILVVNDYEFGILAHKTELSREDVEDRTPVVVVTHGAQGSTISACGEEGETVRHAVPAARLEKEAIDPTGVGDAFRAGLIRGLRIGASWATAGRMGSVAAAFGLEALGPQPPRYSLDEFCSRYRRNFGNDPVLERLTD